MGPAQQAFCITYRQPALRPSRPVRHMQRPPHHPLLPPPAPHSAISHIHLSCRIATAWVNLVCPFISITRLSQDIFLTLFLPILVLSVFLLAFFQSCLSFILSFFFFRFLSLCLRPCSTFRVLQNSLFSIFWPQYAGPLYLYYNPAVGFQIFMRVD